MEIISTLEFFNLTKEESQRKNEDGYTKEECKVLDCGLKWHFYNTLEGITESYQYYFDYSINHDYDCTVFQLSDGRYVIVLG